MPRWLKLVTGLAAALLAGWIYHAPAGGGARFVDALQARAELRVSPRVTDLTGISVRMQRDPLARVAILSGPANDFQRNGIRGYPGLNQRVGSIPGMGAVRWQDEPGCCGTSVMPLLVETLLLCAAAWLIGLGVGRLVFGRRPRTSYLNDEELE